MLSGTPKVLMSFSRAPAKVGGKEDYRKTIEKTFSLALLLHLGYLAPVIGHMYMVRTDNLSNGREGMEEERKTPGLDHFLTSISILRANKIQNYYN